MVQCTCVKVDSLRQQGYSDLEQWMATPGNVLVTRKGRIWITDPITKEKRIFHYPQSPWHNPFKLDSKLKDPQEKDADLQNCLQQYVNYLVQQGWWTKEVLQSLSGLTLGCFCQQQWNAQGQPVCHAAILVWGCHSLGIE